MVKINKPGSGQWQHGTKNPRKRNNFNDFFSLQKCTDPQAKSNYDNLISHVYPGDGFSEGEIIDCGQRGTTTTKCCLFLRMVI